MDGVAGSILRGQQNGNVRERLPWSSAASVMTQSAPLSGSCRRQDAAAVDQGGVVELAILFVEVAPIAGRRAGRGTRLPLTGIPEGFEGSGRGDDLTEAELFLVSFGLMLSLLFGTCGCLHV